MSIVDFIPGEYFVSSQPYWSISLSFWEALLLLGHIFNFCLLVVWSVNYVFLVIRTAQIKMKVTQVSNKRQLGVQTYIMGMYDITEFTFLKKGLVWFDLQAPQQAESA